MDKDTVSNLIDQNSKHRALRDTEHFRQKPIWFWVVDMFCLILLWNLFRAPYRQRNEARVALRELKHLLKIGRS